VSEGRHATYAHACTREDGPLSLEGLGDLPGSATAGCCRFPVAVLPTGYYRCRRSGGRRGGGATTTGRRRNPTPRRTPAEPRRRATAGPPGGSGASRGRRALAKPRCPVRRRAAIPEGDCFGPRRRAARPAARTAWDLSGSRARGGVPAATVRRRHCPGPRPLRLGRAQRPREAALLRAAGASAARRVGQQLAGAKHAHSGWRDPRADFGLDVLARNRPVCRCPCACGDGLRSSVCPPGRSGRRGPGSLRGVSEQVYRLASGVPRRDVVASSGVLGAHPGRYAPGSGREIGPRQPG
jgi:hypothetical protein